MNLEIKKTELSDILPLRTLFLQENNFQVRYNACHERGWTDSYCIFTEDKKIGYGSVKGKEELTDRDTIFEFYILPPFRLHAWSIFSQLIKVSKGKYISCQSNDEFLTALFYEFTGDDLIEAILFKDGNNTNLSIPETTFRQRFYNDEMFEHHLEPEGDFVLEKQGRIVATGGFLLHYNMPFADLYMEVDVHERRKGYGSLLLQEIKKACYLAVRIPSARCNLDNAASKATLLKAGFEICGYVQTGKINDTLL